MFNRTIKKKVMSTTHWVWYSYRPSLLLGGNHGQWS